MNKLIVITGATSGIGAAMASVFDRAGYNLLLLGRRIERLKHLESSTIMIDKVDVTDTLAFKASIQKAEERFGPVDLLINNAGLMLLGQVDTQQSKQWQDMLNINVMAMMTCVQTVLPSLQARKSGSVINISSIAGFKGFPDHAAYCATKYAVRGFSETLRMEMAPYNVRVMVISPGVVETELLSHTSSEQIKSNYNDWKKTIGGAIHPEDIAKTALYMYDLPQNVCIREVAIAPTQQDA